MELPLVYFAGPYTNPDPVKNTHNTIKEADLFYETGICVPVIPHLTLLWHMVVPHDLEFWYEYDLQVMKRCDAVYRLAGTSSGADKEVAEATRLHIPVFTNGMRVTQWCQHWVDTRGGE